MKRAVSASSEQLLLSIDLYLSISIYTYKNAYAYREIYAYAYGHIVHAPKSALCA